MLLIISLFSLLVIIKTSSSFAIVDNESPHKIVRRGIRGDWDPVTSAVNINCDSNRRCSYKVNGNNIELDKPFNAPVQHNRIRVERDVTTSTLEVYCENGECYKKENGKVVKLGPNQFTADQNSTVSAKITSGVCVNDDCSHINSKINLTDIFGGDFNTKFSALLESVDKLQQSPSQISIPNPPVTPIKNKTPAQQSPAENGCEPSITTMNGATYPCKDKLIFDSKFNDGLKQHWNQIVQLSQESEDDFTLYDSFNNITYIESGSLIIKPRLLDDVYYAKDGFTRFGKIDFGDRCTSRSYENCELEPRGHVVLPPIVSGRITTENSFSFRYGTVEIKAKLPKGDWVVPDLWLFPKYRRKNSEKIVIASSVGNDDLLLGHFQVGNKYLYSRLETGPENYSPPYGYSKTSPGPFGDNYHNFKMSWTPEAITFYWNTNLIGYWNSTEHQKFVNNANEKNAPFNNEFYFVLGVHVGGINPTDFPDGAINRGKRKPWKNTQVARRLSFYRDSEEWLKTWSDNTALRVEHVKVWSI